MSDSRISSLSCACGILFIALLASITSAQIPTTNKALPPAQAALKGRTVEDVRVLGDVKVPTSVILNVIRTKPGDKFDPATVEADYHAIYGLHKFSNVEAKAEPTATGVIVTFVVTEQRQIGRITFRGNVAIDTPTLETVADIRPNEAIDNFRIAIARQNIEQQYKEKNYPFVHVEVDQDTLQKTGELIFKIVEGPQVTLRNIDFKGNHSFTEDRLKDQIRTKTWFPILSSGNYDPEMIEDDVAALRRFYNDKGFFDARVGRKLIVSPDQHEMQVRFVINENTRYRVGRIEFRGNTSVSDAQLGAGLRVAKGQYFDAEFLQRDIRQMVKAYSPFGFIYIPLSQNPSPDYLRIEYETRFHKDAGTVDIVYKISEGKPFHLGRVLVKGNTRTQDKVILREMRGVIPGQLYNSAEVADAQDRLRATPYFSNVSITPVGDDPTYRDLLVEVAEAKTAQFIIGGGVNSNGGLGADITYEQRNFDITNPPESWKDLLSERAFIGAGQLFRITLQPGTEQTNASVLFSEPYIFDQPYSFTGEAYYRDRQREHYDETRAGGRLTLGHRFDYVWSAAITLRGEDVDIHNIDDFNQNTNTVPPESIRAPEINDAKGHHTVTSTALSLRRDTTNQGVLPYRGTLTSLGWESYSTLGGTVQPFQKFTADWFFYHTLAEDLTDRKTIFSFHAGAGYIWGSAPFYERFYGGGIGSYGIRGFRYRGVSPRDGAADDPIGGQFSLIGSAEVSFPIAGEMLRGVVFSDFGDVEDDVRFGVFRSSVGAGIRLILPIGALGQAPIALDFAVPTTRSHQDDTQFISFSLGFQR